MVTKIIATKDKIKFTGDFDKSSVLVKIYTASNEKTLIKEIEVQVNDGCFEVNRFIDNIDGLFYQYETDFGGVSFISEIEDDSICAEEFPVVDTKKGLVSEEGDINLYNDLHFKHLDVNISIANVFTVTNCKETEIFIYKNKEYKINKDCVDQIDSFIKPFSDNGVIVYLILLSTRVWKRLEIDPKLENILIHPKNTAFQPWCSFNIETDESLEYYEAFCTFAAQRWVRESGHGRVYGFIVGNEVQSPFIWLQNDSGMLCKDYAKEYLRELRIAHLAGLNEFKNFRTYISLDHFWGKSAEDSKPYSCYPGKKLLENIQKLATETGDFYYCLAPHPYAADLYNANFWSDGKANSNDEAYVLSFKNLEVIQKFVNDEENKYEGKVRRIILSEQGFPSFENDEYSEEVQKEAFGRAYKKVMKFPEIDAFIYYSDYDWPNQLINLGLMHQIGTEDSKLRKPIWYLFRDIDKEANGNYPWEAFADVDPDAFRYD